MWLDNMVHVWTSVQANASVRHVIGGVGEVRHVVGFTWLVPLIGFIG